MKDAEIESAEVSWKVLEIEIHGTVTRPINGNSLPGVVLVAGSGPTDRDWCSPLLPGSNGSARLLTEQLARNGYITLRYDKMASGPHVNENLPKFSGKASMQTHLEELAGAVSVLISQKNIDKNSIFVLTNSEGAIHAVNYQLQDNREHFKGLILTGAPGRSVGEVARQQLVAQGKSIPNAGEILKQYDKAISQFLNRKKIEIDDSVPEGLKKMLLSLEAPANLPFSRELWDFSLSDHIGQVKEPILVIIGKKDIQVGWKEDGKPLENALSQSNDASFVYPENANHVLKYEQLPLEKLTAAHAAMSYNNEEAELDEETTNTILAWLNKHH